MLDFQFLHIQNLMERHTALILNLTYINAD